MDLWSKLTPSKNGCTFYLNSLLEPELLSFLPRNISPSWHPYPLSLEHSSTSFMIAPSLRCSHHSPDTHPLVHARAGRAGTPDLPWPRVAPGKWGWQGQWLLSAQEWVVVDEIRPQVSGVRRRTPAAWAGERRAVEVDSAGYFQAGFIWVASCPLISDIREEWWQTVFLLSYSWTPACSPRTGGLGTAPESREPLAHAQSASQNRPAPVWSCQGLLA